MEQDVKSSRELESLFVDDGEQAIDTSLRMTLEPLIGLTRDGRIVPTGQFSKLSIPSRILAVALARLTLVRLAVPNATPYVTAEALVSEGVAPLKACRETLSRLKAKKFLDKDGESGYLARAWAVGKIADEIKSNS